MHFSTLPLFYAYSSFSKHNKISKLQKIGRNYFIPLPERLYTLEYENTDGSMRCDIDRVLHKY